MGYRSIAPHPALAPYIDAYWSVTGEAGVIASSKILPDGCADILFNIGEELGPMRTGGIYLVGTMTEPIDSVVDPGTKVLGIRFRPGGLFAFHGFSSLHEVTDDIVECEKKMIPDLEELDTYFLKRLSSPGHGLEPVLEDIRYCKGMIRVEELAKRHYTTVRQLERKFRYYIGISPKEFIKQERFRYTLDAIRRRKKGESLSDIAFACGFHDQAHLSHEIRKYTGDAAGTL